MKCIDCEMKDIRKEVLPSGEIIEVVYCWDCDVELSEEMLQDNGDCNAFMPIETRGEIY